MEKASGGVRMAAATKHEHDGVAPLLACRKSASDDAHADQAASAPPAAGTSRPKAKISVMMSERYSLTRGSSSICARPGSLDCSMPMKKLQEVGHDYEDRRAARPKAKKIGRCAEVGRRNALRSLPDRGPGPQRRRVCEKIDRARQVGRSEKRDLQLGEEVLLRRRVDQPRLRSRRPAGRGCTRRL